jgi:hypothetical protein
VVHIICYFTSSLHPLVVLTLAIEFMIVWIGTTVFSIVVYAQDPSVGCAADNYYQSYDNSESESQYRSRTCGKNSGVLVLAAIIT